MKRFITVILLLAVAFPALSQENNDLQKRADQIIEQVCALHEDARYNNAIALLLDNKELFIQAGDFYHLDSVSWLGLLYRNIGDYAKAEASNKELCELSKNLINQNFSFLSEQQRTLYLKAVSRSFEESYSLSSQYPVETVNGLNYTNTLFIKGLLLRTTNAIRDAIYSSGDAALIGQFEQLGKLRQRISQLQHSEDTYKAYLYNLEDVAEAMDKDFTQASVAFRDLKADMEMQWQDVRNNLRPREAALEFVSFQVYDKTWTDTVHYAALVLKPDSKAPVWVPLCNEEELQNILNRRASGRTSYQQARILYDVFGPELYNTTWKPLEQELGGVKTVYYSPSGLLNNIAFNALPTGDPAYERLTDKYDLNLVSSTRELVHLSRNVAETVQISSAVLYGGLDYDADAEAMRMAAQLYKAEAYYDDTVHRGPGWNLSPGTREEALAIQGYLDSKQIPNTLYQDSFGNEESFKYLDSKRTGLIHLATNAFYLEYAEPKGNEKEQTNPMLRSGILFAGVNNAWTNNPVEGVEDGILFADEIASLNLSGTELVALSACDSGLGETSKFEGVYGLQRAFKQAGVKTLIMSLWEVDDYATLKLMKAFYQEWLISGKSKQEAFKEAQRQVRSEFPAPYYWAAFVMMD